jgi:Tfp pilus assembly protein PilF
MNSNAKQIRRRRWIIFGTIALSVIVSAASLYGYRKVRIDRHIAGLKEAGYVSLEAGDPALASSRFRGYLSRHPEDTEALQGLADAIAQMQSGQTNDPSELISIYQRLVVLDPTNDAARIELMNLYHSVNLAKEAIELADSILENQADHIRAREIRALQHARLRQYDTAIKDCKALLLHDPNHLDIRLLMLQLMVQNDVLESDIIAWGGDLTPLLQWETVPESYDPHSSVAKLAQGFAYQLVGRNEQATRLYTELASLDSLDAKHVGFLSSLLDQVGKGDEALALLTREAQASDSSELRAELCKRLWQRGRADDVLTAFGDSIEESLAQPTAFPFVVYALIATNQRERVEPLIEKAQASDDDYLNTWATIFDARRDATRDRAAQLETLSQLKAATERYPTDVHVRAEYAQLLLNARFTEASLAQWEQVATAAPGWSEPMQRIAEIMLATQRDAMALEPAKAAVRRSPNLLRAVLTYFRAANANLDRLSLSEFETLRSLVDRVQEEVKSEALVPLTIELSARAAEDAAKSQAREMLADLIDRQPEYTLGTWTALIRINQRHGFERTDQIVDLARRQHGNAPELAIAAAVGGQATDNVSRSEAALAIFDDWLNEADQPESLSWQLARARLERALKPDQAVVIWRDLIEQFPDEKLIQIQILQDEANWREEDLALVREVLKRDESKHDEREIAPFRIARARVTLMDAESESELAAAADFLVDTSRQYPYLSEPHALLGICYERQGNRSRAIDAYTSAHRIRPNSDALLSARIRLYRELGDTERAQNLLTQYADQMSQSVSADPARLAQTFTMVGDLLQAVQWAEKAVERNPQDVQSALLLARLYLASSREADAERVYMQLLETPTLNVIIAAASFYIQTGRQDEGAALIARLDELELNEDTRAVVRGHFNVTTGDFDSAMVEYEKAAERGDELHATTAFARLISIKLGQDDLNGVLQIAKAAAAKFPNQQRFKAIADNEVLIRSVYGPTTAPFLQRLLVDPDQRPIVEAALRIVRDMSAVSTGADRTPQDEARYKRHLASLRRLADQNQRLVELQNLLVRKYLAAQLNEQAIEIASRATQMFPRNQAVLIAAADANMAAQRWDSAAQVGNQIAQLNPSYQAAADIVAARAALRRGFPNEAIRLMEPYTDLAAEFPKRYDPVIRMQVAAMVAANQTPQQLGSLAAVIENRPDWAVYALDQIINYDSCNEATAAAWIQFAAKSIDSAGENAIAVKIKSATAWHITGLRYPSSSSAANAEAILSQLELDSETAVQATLFRAIFAEERNDLELAERGYRRVLSLQSDNLIALNNLSMVLVKRGKASEALPFAKRAAEAAPRVPIVLDTLANAQIATGNGADAAMTIERAIDLDPKGVPWHITLCRALMAKDDPNAVSEALQTYQRIGDLINASDEVDRTLSQEYLSLRSELDQMLGSPLGSPAITE